LLDNNESQARRHTKVTEHYNLDRTAHCQEGVISGPTTLTDRGETKRGSQGAAPKGKRSKPTQTFFQPHKGEGA